MRRLLGVLGTALLAACAVACGPSDAGGQPSTAPACPVHAARAQHVLPVDTASISVPSSPFGLAARGDTAFVTLGGTAIGVLATRTDPPRLTRTVALPPTLGMANGLAITHDGRYLLVAAGTGLLVMDAAKLAVLGELDGTVGDSAVEVTVSPDDHYAFVSQESGATGDRGDVEVFDLHKALSGGFDPHAYVGSLTLGIAVVGTAVSGRYLYATSEITPTGGTPTETGIGQLSVVNLHTLETDPARALPHSVPAGCDPVRVAVAPGGRTVWVSARASNAVLAFDTAKLATDPKHALLATVPVGTAPVSLIFVPNRNRIIVADSDRFSAPGATTGLTVVNTQAALHGGPADLGAIPTGGFPREFALAGTALLVSDYTSDQVQAVDTATLP